MGKGAKNLATAGRTASGKNAGKWTLLAFNSSRLSPLSERLEQATLLFGRAAEQWGSVLLNLHLFAGNLQFLVTR